MNSKNTRLLLSERTNRRYKYFFLLLSWLRCGNVELVPTETPWLRVPAIGFIPDYANVSTLQLLALWINN